MTTPTFNHPSLVTLSGLVGSEDTPRGLRIRSDRQSFGSKRRTKKHWNPLKETERSGVKGVDILLYNPGNRRFQSGRDCKTLRHEEEGTSVFGVFEPSHPRDLVPLPCRPRSDRSRVNKLPPPPALRTTRGFAVDPLGPTPGAGANGRHGGRTEAGHSPVTPNTNPGSGLLLDPSSPSPTGSFTSLLRPTSENPRIEKRG